MSDPTEPPRPEGSADEPAPTPPPADRPSDVPPPPPPPPSGGDSPYGAPAAAGAGAYGAPPPGGYGQSAAAGGAYSPTEAISYGWRKFSASPGTLLVPMIVVWIGIVVVSVIVELIIANTILSTHDCTTTFLGESVQSQCGPGLGARLFGYGLIAAITTIVWQLLAAGIYKGATHVTDGKPFSVGQLFEGWDKTQVVIAAVIIGVLTGIAAFLCYFPALIVGFFLQYTLLFIVDKQMQAVDAIKASAKFVMDNLGSTLVYYILAAIVLFIGALLCGVGLLVAAPVAVIGLAYTYRRLQNEPVVP